MAWCHSFASWAPHLPLVQHGTRCPWRGTEAVLFYLPLPGLASICSLGIFSCSQYLWATVLAVCCYNRQTR